MVLIATLGCTPLGEDHLVVPSDELVEGDVEDILYAYTPLPDDDREQPVDAIDDALRCFEDARPTEAVAIDDPSADPESGMMGVERDGEFLALPLQRTSFDTVVVGTVAETEVVQVFANPFDAPIEAVYLFPLHERAAVDDYWLTIGERTIRGEMKTREKARRAYESARRSGRAAGLLEQERPNVFTQSVANIPPGESIEISIHVVQPLEQDDGEFSLVLPTVVGPRYIPRDPARVPDASRITAPLMPEGFTACADIDVHVAIESGLRPRALRSSFHSVDITREGDVAFVELDRSAGPVLADRDFILRWDLEQSVPRAAIVAQPDGDGSGGYFTLTLAPPELPPRPEAPPRELVFVVDNSGSMSGEPIETAKELMRRALRQLRPGDAFNVLRFSEAASGLADEVVEATPDNVARGLDYVDAMQGMGGTEMSAGIEAALSMRGSEDRVRMVLFLTDGYIGDEEAIFALIDDRIGDARLFALGIGGAPNRYLLDGMAEVGHGTASYVGIEEDVDTVVDRVYERIHAPVLTNIEIDWRGLDVSEVFPGSIPDLLAGKPVTVFGRYSGAPAGQLVLRANAEGETIELPVAFDVARAEGVDGVASMWARSKIDALLGFHRRVVEWETVQAVTEIALEHRIMTEYTSFVAVDDVQVAEPDAEFETIVQPQLVPAGASYKSFHGIEGLVSADSGPTFSGRSVRVPQVRHAKAIVRGSIDKDIIRRIIRARINEIRSCYNKGLMRDPELAGRIVVMFTIAADGSVPSAVIAEDTAGDAAVGRCMARAAREWTFPREVGASHTIVVSYPFVLRPRR